MRALATRARTEDARRLQSAFAALCAAVHEALPLMNTPKIESAEEKAEAQRREDALQTRLAHSGDATATLRHALIPTITQTTQSGALSFQETDWRLPLLSDETKTDAAH